MRRSLLLSTLIVAMLAGCAGDPETTVDDATPTQPVIEAPVGNLTVATSESDPANITAWLAPFDMGPYSVVRFNYTMPNETTERFDREVVLLELMAVLPTGATLAHSFIHVYDAAGDLQYASSRQPMTFQFSNGPDSPVWGSSGYQIEVSQWSTMVVFDEEMAGRNVSVTFGVDTSAGKGGIMIRQEKGDNDPSRNVTEFLARIKGDVAILPVTSTDRGFATHVYYESNRIGAPSSQSYRFWTSDASYVDSSDPDLQPFPSGRRLTFSASSDAGAGEALLWLSSSFRGSGSWSLTGDLHGTPVDAGGTITPLAGPGAIQAGSGQGGADFQFTLDAYQASVPNVSQAMNLMFISRPIEPTVDEEEPLEDETTLDAFGNLRHMTPYGPMVLEGTASMARDLGFRPA